MFEEVSVEEALQVVKKPRLGKAPIMPKQARKKVKADKRERPIDWGTDEPVPEQSEMGE